MSVRPQRQVSTSKPFEGTACFQILQCSDHGREASTLKGPSRQIDCEIARDGSLFPNLYVVGIEQVKYVVVVGPQK